MNIQSLSGSAAASAAYRNAQSSETSRNQDSSRVEQQAAEQKKAEQTPKKEARPVTNSSGHVTGTTISVEA